jgi:tRNA/tmRNA/rRNA uracil-C5-methylase (TrmA/RlmC/RlmD family)
MQLTCRHRPDCDGCPRFEQTPEKRAAELLAGLHRLAGLFEMKPPSSIIHSEIDLGYRNRARMVVRNGRHPLGFFRAKSREFIGIQQCVVHTDTIEEVLGTVRLLGKHEVMQAAKFVDVRAGENAILTVSLKGDVTDDAVQDFKAQFLSMQPDIGLQLNRGKGHGVLAGQ